MGRLHFGESGAWPVRKLGGDTDIAGTYLREDVAVTAGRDVDLVAIILQHLL